MDVKTKKFLLWLHKNFDLIEKKFLMKKSSEFFEFAENEFNKNDIL